MFHARQSCSLLCRVELRGEEKFSFMPRLTAPGGCDGSLEIGRQLHVESLILEKEVYTFTCVCPQEATSSTSTDNIFSSCDGRITMTKPITRAHVLGHIGCTRVMAIRLTYCRLPSQLRRTSHVTHLSPRCMLRIDLVSAVEAISCRDSLDFAVDSDCMDSLVDSVCTDLLAIDSVALRLR